MPSRSTLTTCAAALPLLVLLAGCETPERRAVRQRLDVLQAQNSALQAQSQAASAQSQQTAMAQSKANLETIELLNKRVELLAQQVAAGAQAKPNPETEQSIKDLQEQIRRSRDQQAAVEAQYNDRLAEMQVRLEAAEAAAKAAALTPKEAKDKSNWQDKALALARFIDSDGKVVDLNAYKGQKQVLLVVMKGFYSQGICVYCSRQAAQLKDKTEAIRALNTEVFVVYPGREEHIPAFVRSIKELEKSQDPRFALPFKVLLDLNQDVVRTLHIDGDLAHPTTFILDRDGIVRYQYTGRTLSDRPKIDDVIAKIRETAAAHPAQAEPKETPKP
ncbi:MAG: peroxiredoxin family protein [Planctomycetes bacterium]|nr:peroxiredoxin family protein [Planctomycetota bacterium]